MSSAITADNRTMQNQMTTDKPAEQITERGCDSLQRFVSRRTLAPQDNKFHKGNGDDGKHYWLTPPELMAELQAEFQFDFDPCPYPKPENFDGLTCEWGKSNYANIPFGSIIHEGKKKGPTAWMRKAIEESKNGKRCVVVYPVDKWILMMLAAGAKVRNLGDVRWCATEDGSQGKGTGRHIAAFILDPTDECANCEGSGKMVHVVSGHEAQCWMCDGKGRVLKPANEKLTCSEPGGGN